MAVSCLALLLPFETWLFELLRHFRLWCAALALLFTVVFLALREWRWLSLAAALAVWQGLPLAATRFPGGQPDSSPGASFRLVTCNLLYEARDPDAMIASLREADPDVLILLEYSPAWQERFRQSLWDRYPVRVEDPQRHPFGICFATRLPLAEGTKPAVVACGPGVPVVTADVMAGGQQVRILGVHPPPPMRPPMHDDWQACLAAWPGLLRQSPARHRILAGDLNCTPFARGFSNLCASASLRDSCQGFGLANTWFAGPVGLPIDHILVSPDLHVLDREIGPPAGSDHRWVSAELAVPAEK